MENDKIKNKHIRLETKLEKRNYYSLCKCKRVMRDITRQRRKEKRKANEQAYGCDEERHAGDWCNKRRYEGQDELKRG